VIALLNSFIPEPTVWFADDHHETLLCSVPSGAFVFEKVRNLMWAIEVGTFAMQPFLPPVFASPQNLCSAPRIVSSFFPPSEPASWPECEIWNFTPRAFARA
jgi:hypothetical protein